MTDAVENISKSIEQAIATGDTAPLRSFLAELVPGEDARVITRLDESEQTQLFSLLPADVIAILFQELSTVQAAELLSRMPIVRAVEVFQRFPSNDQADLLAALPENRAQLLAALPEATSRRLQQLTEHPPDSAGGVMVAEYLTCRFSATVADIIDDLRSHSQQYARLQLQYVYVLDQSDRLTGVLRLRDLLLLERQDPVVKAMTGEPFRVHPELPLEDLARHFDRRPFFGLPVVDDDDKLLGVVLRTDVEEAMSQRAERQLLQLGGVVGGEEFRSMRWTERLWRRGPWLGISLLLSLTASSVIGWYEETLSEVIALAIFLPVISGLGGNSGNQALSISIRELSLGLVRTDEFTWVARKEIVVGAINGLLIGSSLGLISFVWQRNGMLSLVIGLAIAANTLMAACLGGILPLALKRLGWDPAVAAGPILFTIVDLFGFLLALALADYYF